MLLGPTELSEEWLNRSKQSENPALLVLV